MERLTVKRADGRWALANNDGAKPVEQMEKIRFAIDRLAAYEDTGLEPEEVTQIKLTIMGKSLAEIKEFEGVSINRMIELTQAEKDGRLVVLPDAKYTDADGEKALQQAMWVCGNTNNPVTRYTADAIAEKLCREARGEGR